MSERLINILKSILPTPFTIAVGLTSVAFWLAFFVMPREGSYISHGVNILTFWEKGLWNEGLMVFAMQMMLMLVLGHVLALSPFVDKAIKLILRQIHSNASAVFWVTFTTIVCGLFNWGLGLIFGAILARKTGEHAALNKIPINYPLIGACGYAGLMVWHGGLSGSAPLKMAEQNHFLIDKTGVVSLEMTTFSDLNLWITIALIVCVPLLMMFFFKKSDLKIPSIVNSNITEDTASVFGAEKLDRSSILAYIFGGIILFLVVYKWIYFDGSSSIGVLTPNYINLLLLGLGIILHRNFYGFLKAVENAIGGASGILIQFPLYFGIMGMVSNSGLINHFSDFFVSISNENTFPIYTFLSAAVVNIFVPSGGGQWAVQGPIIVDAALKIGVDVPKSVMALAYGDQISNMLQPFWALPLLGITGLKAKEIIPYTLFLMLIGIVIFVGGLIIF
jgi:short-chain fatty acids transporter